MSILSVMAQEWVKLTLNWYQLVPYNVHETIAVVNVLPGCTRAVLEGNELRSFLAVLEGNELHVRMLLQCDSKIDMNFLICDFLVSTSLSRTDNRCRLYLLCCCTAASRILGTSSYSRFLFCLNMACYVIMLLCHVIMLLCHVIMLLCQSSCGWSFTETKHSKVC